MEVSKYILDKARQAGICQEWGDKMAAGIDLHGLLKMYVEGIDFCMEKNFPSNEDLVRLGSDLINEYGIYVDSIKKLSNRDFVVALGKSNISITASGSSVSQVFVKHKSRVMITAKDNSYLVVDCFDDSVINIVGSENSRVLVNIYGDAQTEYSTAGNSIIKIVHKNKKSY